MESEGLTDEQLNQLEGNPVSSAVAGSSDPEQQHATMSAVVGTAKRWMDGLSKFFYGTTGKFVGSMASQVIGGGQAIGGLVTGNEELYRRGKSLQDRTIGNITPGNAAMTVVESAPKALEGVVQAAKLVPGAGKALAKVGTSAASKLAAKAAEQYRSALKVTGGELKAVADKRVPEMLQRGVAGTAEQIARKASSAASAAGEAIDEAMSKLPKSLKLKVQPVIDRLESLKSAYSVEGKVINDTAVEQIQRVQDSVAKLGKEVAPESLRKLRQILDEHYSAAKGLTDIDSYVKKAQRAGADAIRSVFAEQVPDVAKLNREFSFWNDVSKLAETTAAKSSGGKAAGVGGALVGAAIEAGAAGKAVGAIAGYQLAKGAAKVFSSTAWKTASAVVKKKAADQLASGNLKAFDVLLRNLVRGKNVLSSEDRTYEPVD